MHKPVKNKRLTADKQGVWCDICLAIHTFSHASETRLRARTGKSLKNEAVYVCPFHARRFDDVEHIRRLPSGVVFIRNRYDSLEKNND